MIDWVGSRGFKLVEIINHCKLRECHVVIIWGHHDSLCYYEKLNQGKCASLDAHHGRWGCEWAFCPEAFEDMQSSVLTQVSVIHTIPAKQITASPSSLVHLFFSLIDQIFMECLLSDLVELM